MPNLHFDDIIITQTLLFDEDTMLIAIIGENCVGKSTLAESICCEIGGKIYNGKDFLRLERNPDNAKSSFKAILSSAVDGDNVIYVITERERLDLLPEGAVNIVCSPQTLTSLKNVLRGV